MRKIFSVTQLAVAAVVAFATAASAAPRQIVVFVADGLNPQTAEFGSTYIKSAFEQDEPTALENLKSKGQANSVTWLNNQPASLKNLLSTAAANGYKIGLVTTGDVTTVAPLYFNIPADNPDVATTLVKDTKFDLLAGGGRAHFVPQSTAGSLRHDETDLAKTLKDAGGTPVFDLDSLDDEAKGKTIVLHADGDLSYALDRDDEKQSSLDELVSLGVDSLSENDAPFVLIVHDTLLGKALEAKDTPALAGEYYEIDQIVDSLLDRYDDNPKDFGITVIGTGKSTAPVLSTNDADERTNALFILSNLPLSFSEVGVRLKGADDEALTDFTTDEYKGWKLSAANRAAILAGTLNAETAVRASYEPALKTEYRAVPEVTTAYSLGLGAPAELATTLAKIVSSKPGPPTPVTDAGL
jgi:alkaline phosphatase